MIDQRFEILGPFKMAKNATNRRKSFGMPLGSGAQIWWLGDAKITILRPPKWPKMHKMGESFRMPLGAQIWGLGPPKWSFLTTNGHSRASKI